MITILVQSEINNEAKRVASEVLTMAGVNSELMPVVKMTAPEAWFNKPIYEWPKADHIFNSVILLFGIIPIDLHRFGLIDGSLGGIDESSTSLVMKFWQHQRKIEDLGKQVRVTDIVKFQPKLRIIGFLLAPIYEQVFKHRHKRIRKKYDGQ